MSNLTIEAGKFYKTGNGLKVKMLEIVGEYIVGYFDACVGPRPGIWEHTGRYRFGGSDEPLNIVAPWTDPPAVDWDRFPAHIVAVAMDEDGAWNAYLEVPTTDKANPNATGWYHGPSPTNHVYLCAFGVHKEHRPVFSGDWRDSLAVRPGWEEGKE